MKEYKIPSETIGMIETLMQDANIEDINVINALKEYTYYEGECQEGIYKLHIDCGRSGNLEGIFTASKKRCKLVIILWERSLFWRSIRQAFRSL